MRTRVETLLGIDCRAMWISTFHCALRAAAAARSAAHRPVPRLHHLRFGRSAVRHQAAAQGVRPRRQHLPAARGAVAASATPRTGWKGPTRFANTWNPRDQRDRQALRRATSKALQGRQRARLRRPAAEDRRAVRPGAGGARALRPQVPLRDGRRVPGHQPAAVPADQAARRACIATSASSATPISRSTNGAAPTCATSSTSSTTFPRRMIVKLERNYRSTQVILDAASAVIATTATARRRRSGPIARAARRSSTSAAPTSSRRPTTSPGSSARAHRRATSTATIGRALSHQRAVAGGRGCAARGRHRLRVLGGVGFYERKEIKDALAYLKLILNPHDDVALRRVINVPARGIGKGVMDALEGRYGVAPTTRPAAAAAPACSQRSAANSLWTQARHAASTRGTLTGRRLASLAAFRDLIVDARRDGRDASRCPSRSARSSTQRATCATCARTAARRPRAASRT